MDAGTPRFAIVRVERRAQIALTAGNGAAHRLCSLHRQKLGRSGEDGIDLPGRQLLPHDLELLIDQIGHHLGNGLRDPSSE